MRKSDKMPSKTVFDPICIWQFIQKVVKYDQSKQLINNHKDFMTLSESLKNVLQLKRSKIVSEYDQEIPQSQTADKPMAPQGRATQPSRDTRKTN